MDKFGVSRCCCGARYLKCDCSLVCTEGTTPCCVTITIEGAENLPADNFAHCNECESLNGTYILTSNLDSCHWRGSLCQNGGTARPGVCCAYEHVELIYRDRLPFSGEEEGHRWYLTFVNGPTYTAEHDHDPEDLDDPEYKINCESLSLTMEATASDIEAETTEFWCKFPLEITVRTSSSDARSGCIEEYTCRDDTGSRWPRCDCWDLPLSYTVSFDEDIILKEHEAEEDECVIGDVLSDLNSPLTLRYKTAYWSETAGPWGISERLAYDQARLDCIIDIGSFTKINALGPSCQPGQYVGVEMWITRMPTLTVPTVPFQFDLAAVIAFVEFDELGEKTYSAYLWKRVSSDCSSPSPETHWSERSGCECTGTIGDSSGWELVESGDVLRTTDDGGFDPIQIVPSEIYDFSDLSTVNVSFPEDTDNCGDNDPCPEDGCMTCIDDYNTGPVNIGVEFQANTKAPETPEPPPGQFIFPLEINGDCEDSCPHLESGMYVLEYNNGNGGSGVRCLGGDVWTTITTERNDLGQSVSVPKKVYSGGCSWRYRVEGFSGCGMYRISLGNYTIGADPYHWIIRLAIGGNQNFNAQNPTVFSTTWSLIFETQIPILSEIGGVQASTPEQTKYLMMEQLDGLELELVSQRNGMRNQQIVFSEACHIDETTDAAPVILRTL